MAWIRRHLIAFAGIAVLIYMLVPNIVVAVFSFNEPKGKFNYTFNEFSTAAWTNPCGTQGICESLGLSLQIGVVASLVATVLGTMIAFALGRCARNGLPLREGQYVTTGAATGIHEIRPGETGRIVFDGVGAIELRAVAREPG